MTQVKKLRNLLSNGVSPTNTNSAKVNSITLAMSESMATFHSTWTLESSIGNNGFADRGKLDSLTKSKILDELSPEEKVCLQEIRLI